jgi:hypoxanthine-DNA glycosylase
MTMLMQVSRSAGQGFAHGPKARGQLQVDSAVAARCQISQNTNRFWHLVGDVIGTNLVELEYAARLRKLLEHRNGLWDVVLEARRVGSLDSHIRDHASNDLIPLIEALPNLVVVAFNGGTAEKIGTRALGERGRQYRLLRLPSSSPAYAALPYFDKLTAWRQLGEYLNRC